MGGKAGAVAVKVAKGSDETSATTTDGGGAVAPPEVTSSTTNPMVTKMEAVLMVPPRLTKPPELLHEATQLLKALRVPMNPKLKAMQLSNIEAVDDEYILLDS